MKNYVDISGQRFGRLVAISVQGTTADRKKLWLCECDCGNTKAITGKHLRDGAIVSCGCYHLEQITTHGMSKTRIYRTWNMMLQRCTNPKNSHYHHYGGRGISVCYRWKKFENFFEDMGPRPEGMTIERKENDLGYSPDNCVWATVTEQLRNQRIQKRSKTGVNGVVVATSGRYIAKIGVNKKQISLGTFDTIGEAAEARKQGEIKYWGKEIAT